MSNEGTIDTIFDAIIETIGSSDGTEGISTEPSPDQKNAMRVYITREGKDPEPFCDLSINKVNKIEHGWAVLLIKGGEEIDKRVTIESNRSDQIRFVLPVWKTEEGREKITIAVFLNPLFSKLVIEVQNSELSFKLT